jgi:selenocysteine lyase/cysteine desulfurase
MLSDEFRARFPLLGRRVYVNSCSQGALSLDVEAAVGRFMASWHEEGSPWERWVGEVERLRGAAAGLIGASADEVAIVPSASAAISAVATALSFDGPRTGVVLGEFEFPTMAQVWLAQQRRGAIITRVPAQGETLPIEEYASRIDERTLVVPATHVCFRNGYRLDIPRLAALCRQRGAFLFLDDYQHTGTAPLDVRALGADFMVTGALKYLLGMSGVAFLYVRRELIHRLEPLATGWFARSNPFAFTAPSDVDWSSSARRFEAGTPAIANVYAACAGIELLQRLGLDAIERRINALVARFIAGARDRDLDMVTPEEPARRGPLAVVRMPDAAAVVRSLERHGIIASARGNGVRLSFHAYNNEEDVEAVLTALARVQESATRGARPHQ